MQEHFGNRELSDTDDDLEVELGEAVGNMDDVEFSAKSK